MPGEGGQDQDASVGVNASHTGREFEPAHLRHLNVSDQNLRPILSDCLKGLFSVGIGPKHLNIGFDRQQRCECASQHALVFGQHYAYLFRQRGSAFPTNRESDCSSDTLSTGKMISRLVPSLAEAVNFMAPVIDSTLSRMPRRPLPSQIWPPSPLSSTVK